jgi:hypothetical protein
VHCRRGRVGGLGQGWTVGVDVGGQGVWVSGWEHGASPKLDEGYLVAKQHSSSVGVGGR